MSTTGMQSKIYDTDQVTVILTVWKRNRVIEQLEALFSQDHLPHQIWVYHCKEFVRPNFQLLSEYPTVQYQYNSMNFGYFGRFNLGLLAQTPYLFIIDDDVIPSPNWISNCIQLSKVNNAIIASAGRLLLPGDYMPEKSPGAHWIGDSNLYGQTNVNEKDVVVDFGCNSWFLRTEWLHHFWSMKPFTMDSGEDIHLSATCNLKAGIPTICPSQHAQSVCGNLKKEYGFDEYASCNTSSFLQIRERILRYWINEKGWRPLKWAALAVN